MLRIAEASAAGKTSKEQFMGTVGKVMVTMVNTSVGEGNPSIVDFDFNTAESLESVVARCLGYIDRAGANSMGVGSRVTGVRYRPQGAGGSTDVPFPVTAYLDLTATHPTLPLHAAYNFPIGAGPLAPRGTSVCVSEQTFTAGRTGRGRHFLPFTGHNATTSAGLLAEVYAVAIEEAATTFLGISDPLAGPGYTIGWSVTDKNGSSYKLITSVKCRQVLSNLRSRRS
jgi:hypothetical protein